MFRRSFARQAALGFIGLGQMGARMAPNAFKSDHNTELHVFDVNSSAMEEVKKTCTTSHVHFAASPADVARKCERIITMLPNGNIVKHVFEGDNGLLSGLQPGTLVCDCSTIDTDTPKVLAASVVNKGAVFCDAPVSGGVNAAAAGILTFMVGAVCDKDFERAKELLTPFSKAVVHCGPVGTGQVVKICNNLILGQTMIAVSEAMLLGTKLGADPKTLANVINSSSGSCWTSTLYNPYPGVMDNVPSSRGYTGGFGASLMLKDLGLAMDAAKQAGVQMPGGQNAKNTYTDMVDSEMGALDFSGVLKYIEQLKQ